MASRTEAFKDTGNYVRRRCTETNPQVAVRVEVGVQVNMDNPKGTVTDLGNEISFVSFQAIKEKEWDSETYKITEVIEGVNVNPINVTDDYVKVVWVDPKEYESVVENHWKVEDNKGDTGRL